MQNRPKKVKNKENIAKINRLQHDSHISQTLQQPNKRVYPKFSQNWVSDKFLMIKKPEFSLVTYI